MCEKCASPRENGVTDYCMDSVLHRVLRARKLIPLDEKRIIALERRKGQRNSKTTSQEDTKGIGILD
ncbi:MAG TPA: hypothetical protein VE521_03735 [Nitrososphaera sp.]|nr:hypothetical protein [Nitrososphaera sp.]